jgi:two-component system chemotaxis response regulator CheB
MTTATPPRVVVADDSALMRRIVSNLLTRGGVQVVGAAKDGDEALALCESERPDAMTLDLAMPGLGGIDVLKALRKKGGPMIPVVVVSAFSPAHGARAVDALAEGAFELVSKPSGNGDVEAFEQSLLAKIRQAVAAQRPRPRAAGNGAVAVAAPRIRPAGAGTPVAPRRPSTRSRASQVLLIATSTGGPRALAALVPGLPAQLGLGTMIVQHMPAGFTASLAARLDRSSALTVREAAGGEKLEPGLALIAPGGRHLRLGPDGHTVLSDEAPLGGLRPRADLLIEDAARQFGERLLLVVLTGMGNDGLRGAHEVRKRGGRILAEAEQTCTVYGMPRAIVEAKLADDVFPLDQMADAISTEMKR